MVNEDSPVRDFYPLEFETDLNGKQMEWEAVVLIPFIDERRLLDAMKPCSIHLSDEVRDDGDCGEGKQERERGRREREKLHSVKEGKKGRREGGRGRECVCVCVRERERERERKREKLGEIVREE